VPRPSPQAQLQTQLRLLQRYRNKPKADFSIAKDVEAIRKALVRTANAAGGMEEVWGELVPQGLAGVSRVVKLTPGGVLTVSANDSAVVYELDQWLRGGGLATLRARCKVTLRRVKLVSR
jgi:hypothetical protein